ncbi:hypothetical protein GCM10022221_45910 [Actinocorallia aurea]
MVRFEVAPVPEGPVLKASDFRVYFWEFSPEGVWLNCSDEYEVRGVAEVGGFLGFAQGCAGAGVA